MSRQRKKQIEALQSRIEELRAQEEREEHERVIIEEAYRALTEQLANAGVSFESFVRFSFKEVRRAMAKIEREEGPPAEEKPVRRKAAKKRPVRKARARKSRKAAARPVKIPPGKYTNVPPEPEKVYQIKEKGPRPKAVKAHAESIGIDAFMEQCRVGE